MVKETIFNICINEKYFSLLLIYQLFGYNFGKIQIKSLDYNDFNWLLPKYYLLFLFRISCIAGEANFQLLDIEILYLCTNFLVLVLKIMKMLEVQIHIEVLIFEKNQILLWHHLKWRKSQTRYRLVVWGIFLFLREIAWSNHRKVVDKIPLLQLLDCSSSKSSNKVYCNWPKSNEKKLIWKKAKN